MSSQVQEPESNRARRLDGWKDIGQYIGKTARTAQRWEQEFGLPVHRIVGNNHEIVFALQEEIDKWQISSERLRFEALLADVSRRFIHVPPDKLEDEIQGAMEEIATSLSIDHFNLWQYSPDDPDHMWLTHAVVEGEPQSVQTKVKGSDVVPYAHRELLANRIVYFADTSNIPPEVDPLTRATWERLGFKAVLALPLSTGGRRPTGAIGIGSFRPRQWSEIMRRRLQLLAEIFANALDRKFADQKLQEEELRLKLAAEAAGVGMFTLDPLTGSMWASDILLKLAGLSPDDEFNFQKVMAILHPEDRKTMPNAVTRAMESDQEVTITFRFVHPDGSIHRMMSRGCRHRYSEQGPFLLMGVTFEID